MVAGRTGRRLTPEGLYDSLLSEGAAEWTRLGVEALVLEFFFTILEPLTCIFSPKFLESSQLHGDILRAEV